MGKYARPGSDGWTYKDQLQMEKWLNNNPITKILCGILLLPFAIIFGIVLIPAVLMLLILFSPIWIPIAFIKGLFKRK